MKPPFAKLFEVEGEQVLFFLEPDSENDGCECIHQIVRISGLYIDMKAAGIRATSVDASFAKIDEKYARSTLATARKLLSEVA